MCRFVEVLMQIRVIVSQFIVPLARTKGASIHQCHCHPPSHTPGRCVCVYVGACIHLCACILGDCSRLQLVARADVQGVVGRGRMDAIDDQTDA